MNAIKRSNGLLATALLGLGTLAGNIAVGATGNSPSTVGEDGTTHTAAGSIPFSSLASEQAKKVFVEGTQAAQKGQASTPPPKDPTTAAELDQLILRWREESDELRKKIAQDMTEVFPVTITPEVMGTVQTDVVLPRGGVSAQNKNRVLINLHGGGMIFGARYEGQVMSIPIANLGKI
jgi:monoterpene epsilon-lactone hydrolase